MYDLSSLSPIEFETLICDLLQKSLGVTFEKFGAGADQGIDLRHVGSDGKIVIVQCKHYHRSGGTKLLSDVRLKELSKVSALRPDRYILATSAPLTPALKTNLTDVLHPHIKNPADILGLDDINNLLRQFPEIELASPKLWLHSEAVMRNIIHANIENFSQVRIAQASKEARMYVKNASVDLAHEILQKRRMCIIAGQPGIGKTTLANHICLQYAKLGYKVIYISKDIDDAFPFTRNNLPTLYYYDDFLGSNELSKNEDDRLLTFMNFIKDSDTAWLLMTTREYILQKASLTSERMARAGLERDMFVLNLQHYTREIRALILYQHLYYSEVQIPTYFEEFGGAIIKVVDHPNYNPRVVAAMMELEKFKIAGSDFWDAFQKNLDDPVLIWGTIFRDKLTPQARDLLLVLFTLSPFAYLSQLKKAFSGYRKLRRDLDGAVLRDDDFDIAAKELLGSFIESSMAGSEAQIEFQNPSIADFLSRFISSQPTIVDNLLAGALFEEQVVRLTFTMPEIYVRPAFIAAAIRCVSVYARPIDSELARQEAYSDSFHVLREWTHESKSAKLRRILGRYIAHGLLYLEDDKWEIEPLIHIFGVLIRSSKFSVSRYSDQIEKFTYRFISEYDWLDSFFDYGNMIELINPPVRERCYEILRDAFETDATHYCIAKASSNRSSERLQDDLNELYDIAEEIGADLPPEIHLVEKRIKAAKARERRAARKNQQAVQPNINSKEIEDQDIMNIFKSLRNV